MNPPQFRIKTFTTPDGKTYERKLIKIKIKDLEVHMGTDINDVDKNYKNNNTKGDGWFAPTKGKYNHKFISNVITGEQPAFKNREVKIIKLPETEECGWKFLKPLVYTLPQVMKYIPERYHRSGQYKGLKILDDIQFTASIFGKVMPERFETWLENQKKLNKSRLNPEEEVYIEVEAEWYEKIQFEEMNHHKDGKVGRMLINHQRTKELKRKRERIDRMAAMQQVSQDRVWMPPTNLQNTDFIPNGKDFVEATTFMSTHRELNNQRQFNIQQNEFVIHQPWRISATSPTIEDRRIVYEVTRADLLTFYGKYNYTIPDFDEALRKWG